MKEKKNADTEALRSPRKPLMPQKEQKKNRLMLTVLMSAFALEDSAEGILPFRDAVCALFNSGERTARVFQQSKISFTNDMCACANFIPSFSLSTVLSLPHTPMQRKVPQPCCSLFV